LNWETGTRGAEGEAKTREPFLSVQKLSEEAHLLTLAPRRPTTPLDVKETLAIKSFPFSKP